MLWHMKKKKIIIDVKNKNVNDQHFVYVDKYFFFLLKRNKNYF